MAPFADTHTRVVFWLKIVLPLAALVLLSTLFLFSRRIDTETALPYAEVDVEELARQQRLTAPEFSGVTSDGSAISVRAAVARPGDGAETGARAEGLTAIIDLKSGPQARLSAGEGRIDSAAGTLTLDGGVRAELSNGYDLTTDSVTARLDRTEVRAPATVKATAPYGRIEAGGFTLTATEGPTPGHVLVFNGGVRLLYDPPGQASP